MLERGRRRAGRNKKNVKEYQLLIATPTVLWATDTLIHLLESHGFSIVKVNSAQDVLPFISTHNFTAILILSDWALEIRLMEYVKGKTPTICLISQETWQNHRINWFDELFHPPTHEYISLPTDADELVIRLEKVLKHSE